MIGIINGKNVMKDVEKRIKTIVWTAGIVSGRKKSSDGYGALTKLPLKSKILGGSLRV